MISQLPFFFPHSLKWRQTRHPNRLQVDVASLLHALQPKVSELKNYRIDGLNRPVPRIYAK